MGVVYEAQQKSLNRRVALKVLSTGLGLTTKAIMRFKREAEAAARLHHTNIVPIYYTCDEGRVPYYAMELVNGPSLDQVIQQLRTDSDVPSSGSVDSTDDGAVEEPSVVPDWVNATVGFEKPSSNREDTKATSTSGTSSFSSGSGSTSTYFDNVAGMMAGVADALAHAHDQGVIHRDIKPSNLLLSQDGRLSVNDFGLARLLEQPGMTISGELMGSPMYMSPEQITSGRIPLDHRTDIYSLGASLYQMLTLQTPFEGQRRDQVLSQIIHKEPTSPRSINNKIPKDLETICLKAMEKDPDRRYQTADIMAQDLRHFVDRNAISARRVGPLERGTRWARKNKAITAMACITLMVIVSATTFFYVSNRNQRLEAEAQHRNQRRDEAKQQALTAALSGMEEQAIKRIAEAKRYGADENWGLMILSQVDNFRGDSEACCTKLKIVVDNDPKNFEAHFMLLHAYLITGKGREHYQKLTELESRRAETPIEKLYMAKATMWHSPEESLSTFDDLIADPRTRDFDLLWLERAMARTYFAQDQDDASQILEALREIDSVRLRVGEDHPLLLCIRLATRLTAYHIFLRAEETDIAESHLGDAAEDVKLLAANPRYLMGNHFRMLYWDIEGNTDNNLRKVFREATSKGHREYILDTYLTYLYRRGQYSELSAELERTELDDPNAAMSKIFSLMDSQGGREEATKIAKEMLCEGDPVSREFALRCLFLLGKEGLAMKEANKFVKERKLLGFFKRDFLAGYEYMAGRISPEELVRTAQSSERSLGRAYHFIGLRNLAKGNREVALDSFDKSASSLAFSDTAVRWSRAFAERLRADTDWPDWLPAAIAESK